MTLRARREALGLTQAEVADRAGTAQPEYGQVESGRTKMPNAELRRAISEALGLRHVDYLVEVGELEDWELPGFDAAAEPIDPAVDVLLHLVRTTNLLRNGRAETLASILQFWQSEDQQAATPGTRPPHPSADGDDH